jgi:alkyl hydroperoxide reductase subunit AhpF
MNLDSITPNFAGSYDVLVVGATPAGVATAPLGTIVTLAEAGPVPTALMARTLQL